MGINSKDFESWDSKFKGCNLCELIDINVNAVKFGGTFVLEAI